MQQVDVVAVVGACAPERAGYAQRLAVMTGREFVPAGHLAMAEDPVGEAATIVPWIDAPAGAVLELPHGAAVTELIGALAERDAWVRLSAIVCVIDAAHVLDDLQHEGDATALTVAQVEYASTIVLVNWTGMPTRELSTVMSLLNHLGPRARLRLHRGVIEPWVVGDPYTAYQDRAGWIAVLNDDDAAHVTDARVSAVRYENVRPLHPGRLHRLLTTRWDSGELGTVIRSAGFLRLASRPRIVARWDHAGRTITLDPLAHDDDLGDDDELLALGEDLAIIGLDLDADGLRAALDSAALSDEELTAGPELWASFDDPFPLWTRIDSR